MAVFFFQVVLVLPVSRTNYMIEGSVKEVIVDCFQLTVDKWLNFLILQNVFFHYRFKVRIGDYNHTFDVNFSGALILEITGVHKHPKYTVGNYYYDVAVLTTEVVNATVVMTFWTNVRITRLITSNN